MAVFKLLTIQSPTTTGTVTYTHNMGVTPKVAVGLSSGINVLNTQGYSVMQNYFMYDGTTHRSFFFDVRYKYLPERSAAHQDNNTLYVVTRQANHTPDEIGYLNYGPITSWNSSTISINWQQVQGYGTRIALLLIGGNDVQARVVSFNSPTSPGTQVISGVGFQPDVILFMNRWWSGLFGSLHFGAAAANNPQFGISIASRDNSQPTTDFSHQAPVGFVIYQNTALYAASVVGVTSDGFILDWQVVSSSAPFAALCIKGLKAKIGSFFYTGSGTQVISGIGFRPQCVLLATIWSPGLSQFNNIQQSIGIGLHDNSVFCTSCYGQHGVSSGTNVVYRLDSQSRILHDASGTFRYATLSGMTDDGFAIQWSTSAPQANTYVWYIALGSGYDISVAPGVHSSVGTTIGVLRDRIFAAEKTAYTQVSANPGDEWAARADPGLRALVGSAASLDITTGVQFSAGSGTHDIVGSNSTIDMLRIARPGIYAASGTAITIDRATALETGTYTLTGAESLGERTFNADKGAYILSGQQAGLLSDAIFRHDPGLYGITGREALFIAERLIVPEKGNLIVVGDDASLTRHLVMGISQESYNATGALVGVDLAANATVIPYTVTGAVSTSERAMIAATEAYALAGVANEMRGPWAVSRGAYGTQGRPFGVGRFSPPRALLVRRVFIPVRMRRRGIQDS